MKKLVAILICVVAALAVGWGLWANHERASKTVAANPPINLAPGVWPKPPSPVPVSSTAVKPKEWQEFQADRDTTLKTDAAIAPEYQALLAEMQTQQNALDAAMIKADPKVALALAKLELIRKHVPAPGSTPAKPKIYVLTPAEWQHIQAARQAALKANPDFDQKAMQLAAQLQALQQKVDAAMAKADPNVAPIMAKLDGGHPPPQ